MLSFCKIGGKSIYQLFSTCFCTQCSPQPRRAYACGLERELNVSERHKKKSSGPGVTHEYENIIGFVPVS
jgi:hypothetical protein